MTALIHGDNATAYTTFNGGGKSAPTPPPMVAPAPPVEEASVELDEEGKRTRARTAKSSLKMPLVSTNTGLKL